MNFKREYLILIVFTAILIIIIFTLAFFALSKPEATPETSLNPTPTTQSTNPETIVPTSSTKTNPPVKYEPTGTLKMLDKLNNKTPLSTSDSVAKQKILTLLPAGQVSGVLYKSSTVIIDYTHAADEFQGEILTVDIAQAKKDAVLWFASEGVSQKAVCNMPVVFYLNYNVANHLRGTGVQFNPLAEGC